MYAHPLLDDLYIQLYLSSIPFGRVTSIPYVADYAIPTSLAYYRRCSIWLIKCSNNYGKVFAKIHTVFMYANSLLHDLPVADGPESIRASLFWVPHAAKRAPCGYVVRVLIISGQPTGQEHVTLVLLWEPSDL